MLTMHIQYFFRYNYIASGYQKVRKITTKRRVLPYSRIYNTKTKQMKSTLKVHNPRVIILLICLSDVQCVINECHR